MRHERHSIITRMRGVAGYHHHVGRDELPLLMVATIPSMRQRKKIMKKKKRDEKMMAKSFIVFHNSSDPSNIARQQHGTNDECWEKGMLSVSIPFLHNGGQNHLRSQSHYKSTISPSCFYTNLLERVVLMNTPSLNHRKAICGDPWATQEIMYSVPSRIGAL